MLFYIILICIVVVVIILISNYINYTKINNESMNLQQSTHPNSEIITLMLNKKQPTIFLQEIALWEGIDLLIGYNYENIRDVFQGNKIILKALKYYLKPYCLPLSYDWDINLKVETKDWDQLSNYPTQETSYNHLIGNFSGLMMICILHPNQEKLINKLKEKNIDFKLYLKENEIVKKKELKEQLENKDVNDENKSNDKNNYLDIDYITIPIRPANMIYIPYKWYYFIYCGESDSYTTYLDIKNKTII